jgi:hypothetical protein
VLRSVRHKTPWEILRQTPRLFGFLRAELTVISLQETAGVKSDTQAAIAMREPKR